MGRSLLIVESPAKAKTIKKYLGKDFEVLASYGHVRDLLPKEGAVDVGNNFTMRYQALEKSTKNVDAIIKTLKKCDALILATDPDREGEAISWHLCELLKERNLLKEKAVARVVFHEMTKHAILEGVNNPRDLSMDLVNAQQARRALDYLVGFNLSPLLWKKVRHGLSAGRVQSPALRLIVEREEEIEKFESREYWSIDADLESESLMFKARLAEYQAEKVEQFSFVNEAQAMAVKATLEQAASGQLTVTKVEKKQRKRNPAPPFITSTLQQEAARKCGFTAQRTMRIAQQLYEGIDIGNDGAEGLISYMRTDSVSLADEAVADIRQLIAARYGADNVPDEPRKFKTKSKNAQEAHEAIRPTSVHNLPEKVKAYLTDEQYKLYNLIWKRAVACQMIHATIDTVSADLTDNESNRFRANGSTVATPGFIAVYQEGVDDAKRSDSDEKMLPQLAEGEVVPLKRINADQHFTEPPPRYSEATLIKALEEYGIGRPSTYTSIISAIQSREYAELDNKRFMPTDVGRIVNKFLTKYFPQYVDYSFTANLEDELDAISRGEEDWVPLLSGFWQPFKSLVDEIEETVQRKDVTHEEIDEKCPKCSSKLSIRLGRRGRFIGCTAYPECDYTRNASESAEQAQAQSDEVAGRKCPLCDSDLLVRHGRYGKFIGCSSYPDCRYIEPLEKPVNTEVTCPTCKKGTMLQRRSRRGKEFFSCSKYPTCKYAVWDKPINQSCPACHWPMLTFKTTKKRGTEKICPQKECGYRTAAEAEAK